VGHFMANTLKDAEATILSNTPSTSANPAAKSADASTRTQPVALEIPVTINGAHTIEGSDKREPFSETTQTVLVFGHGAVVRVATSLAAGQLVFLTNEKSKKEMVCQVVKSKSGGSGSYYVELQFTEPAPGFWGLRMPTAPPAPAAPAVVPRPAAATTPATPALPKPAAPSAIAPAPAPPAPTKPQPGAPVASSPASSSPTLSVPPSAQAALPAAPSAAPPASLKIDRPAAPEKQNTLNSEPLLSDYSKQIDALFTVPPASPSQTTTSAPPEPKAIAPAASHPAASALTEPKMIPPAPPSSEQLKLEAARLQAQLSSMLFTESPASSRVPPPPPPPIHKPEPPPPDVAKKVFEIAHDEPKFSAVTEHKPAPPARKPTAPPISADDEEVKIPSWLAPLSRESESAVAEHPAPTPTESLPELPAIHSDSAESDSIDSHRRPEAAVFGGELLGEISAEAAESSSNGSKKGLFFALAAALVLAGGGVWYFRPSLFGSSHAGTIASSSVPAASAEAAPANPAPSEVSTASSSPLSNARPNSAPAAAAPVPAVSQLSKTAAPNPTPAVMANPEPRNSASTSHNNAPAPAEESAKSPLGEVHLAAPVVSHEANAVQSADTPSIDAHEPNSGADTLPTVAISSHQGPAAPLPLGGDVHQAQLLKSVPPVYPAVAKSQHISGSVQVDALIDTSGNVAELKIISGPSLLHRAALDAVKQWKYKPAMLDGQPTSMHLVVTVQFRTQ
jgi:TonB family protein